jgi:hypothetical protein
VWRNPNHPAPEQPTPPAESGERLATFSRGQGVELRITLDEYEGRPYIGLRLWELGQSGGWWPTKRGVTIRLRELAELLEVLGQVENQDRPPVRARQEHEHRHASTPVGQGATPPSNGLRRAPEHEPARPPAGQGATTPPWIPMTLASGVPHQAGRPAPPEPTAGTMPTRSDRPRFVERRRRPEPRDPSTLPELPEPGEGFDEFGQ